MAEAEITSAVESYYSGAFARHGATPRGVDWNSAESQELRFAQLARACPPDRRFTLNDYGCGYGGLLPFLRAAGYDVAYTGYDLSAAMVEHARAAHGGPGVRFTTRPEELEVADVTVASGIFNVRLGFDSERWAAYVQETIDRLAALSSRALAFNMLTSYSDPERMRDDLHYADPLQVFDRCKRTIAPAVALLHDYGLWEFTIIVRKEL